MTVKVPIVGIDSIAGSKVPRVRPTRMLASRKVYAASANLRASWSSRPIDLTTRAASKLS